MAPAASAKKPPNSNTSRATELWACSSSLLLRAVWPPHFQHLFIELLLILDTMVRLVVPLVLLLAEAAAAALVAPHCGVRRACAPLVVGRTPPAAAMCASQSSGGGSGGSSSTEQQPQQQSAPHPAAEIPHPQHSSSNEISVLVSGGHVPACSLKSSQATGALIQSARAAPPPVTHSRLRRWYVRASALSSA